MRRQVLQALRVGFGRCLITTDDAGRSKILRHAQNLQRQQRQLARIAGQDGQLCALLVQIIEQFNRTLRRLSLLRKLAFMFQQPSVFLRRYGLRQ